MWIPTSVYERLPQCWLLLSLLFMSSGVYLGFDFNLSFLYFGTGVFCLCWALRILVMRKIFRRAPENAEQLIEVEQEQALDGEAA